MEFKTPKSVFLAILLGMLVLLSSCKETGSIGEYQSIPQLYDSCPGNCGEQLACEGHLVKVWGYLDAHNIFDQSHNDQESARFVIAEELDDQGFAKGRRIEVTSPQDGNNVSLFDKFNEASESSKILITGNVKGYDAPTNLSCQRLISLKIQGEEDVNIK